MSATAPGNSNSCMCEVTPAETESSGGPRMSVNVSMKAVGRCCLVCLLAVANLAAGSGLALVDAVRMGDKEAVFSQLMGKADVNMPEADGTTALAWAAHR